MFYRCQVDYRGEEDGVAREKAGSCIGLFIVVFHPLSRLLGRRRFEGLEHIPQAGPVLVACNHISYLDPICTGVFMHHGGRIPRFLAKQALATGKAVLIYPEGTITRDPDHWPMVAHTGVARLALHADIPVVPVMHWGPHRVYDHYGKRFRPLPRTDVIVRAGAPVDLSEFRRRPLDGPLLRDATDRVMDRVRQLFEMRSGPAPSGFFDPLHPHQPGERPS